MPLPSQLKSRRIAKRIEASHQLIVFQLQHEWFAIPIQSVQKVIPLGQVYGDPHHTGVSLTIYQERELVVVDVGHRIFGQAPNIQTFSEQSPVPSSQQYLLLVQNLQGDVVGLPISSPPQLRRVAKSAFGPLPAAYQSQGNILCVSSVVIETESEPLIFLIDPEVLVRPQLLTRPIGVPPIRRP